MTPLLLTLASLTPGDGGPVGGAARAPVEAAVKLDTFEGFLRLPGGPSLKARLEQGDLCVSYPAGCTIFLRCTLSRDEAGGFRLSGPATSSAGLGRRIGRIGRRGGLAQLRAVGAACDLARPSRGGRTPGGYRAADPLTGRA